MFGRHLTVYGNSREDDIGVELQTAQDSAAEVVVVDSIIDNVSTSLMRRGNGGDAQITAYFSNYSAEPASDNIGTGGVSSTGRVEGPPQFVNPSAGDFHLDAASPLIDAASTLPLSFFESPVDLEGRPRVLAGHAQDGRCEARRDLGALEFLPAVLFAHVSADTGAVSGTPVAFDATRSCDPDPDAVLTFRWLFDDGGTAAGAKVLHTFASSGEHRATVQITSSGGRTASVTSVVMVGPAPTADLGESATGGTKKSKDTKRPRAHRLDIRPFKFRAAGGGASVARSIGALVRYRLSEPAKVRFTAQRVTRRAEGRKNFIELRGSFKHQGRKDSNKFRFTGRLGSSKLRPGLYRMVGVPTDAAGNRGKAVRALFRIVKR